MVTLFTREKTLVQKSPAAENQNPWTKKRREIKRMRNGSTLVSMRVGWLELGRRRGHGRWWWRRRGRRRRGERLNPFWSWFWFLEGERGLSIAVFLVNLCNKCIIMRARYLSLFSLPEAHTGICYWILNEIYCRFDSVASFSSVAPMEIFVFVCLFVLWAWIGIWATSLKWLFILVLFVFNKVVNRPKVYWGILICLQVSVGKNSQLNESIEKTIY